MWKPIWKHWFSIISHIFCLQNICLMHQENLNHVAASLPKVHGRGMVMVMKCSQEILIDTVDLRWIFTEGSSRYPLWWSMQHWHCRLSKVSQELSFLVMQENGKVSAKIQIPDVDLCGSVVHVVNRVLLPPDDTTLLQQPESCGRMEDLLNSPIGKSQFQHLSKLLTKSGKRFVFSIYLLSTKLKDFNYEIQSSLRTLKSTIDSISSRTQRAHSCCHIANCVLLRGSNVMSCTLPCHEGFLPFNVNYSMRPVHWICGSCITQRHSVLLSWVSSVL